MSASESGQTESAPAPTPAKKRSPIERAVVWGGIVAMLVVVYMEWSSRQGFDAAMASLETAVHKTDNEGTAKGLPVAEVANHVKGYVTRGEETQDKTKKITYQWPSLFKTYKLGLTVNDEGNVILVESYAAKEDAK